MYIHEYCLQIQKAYLSLVFSFLFLTLLIQVGTIAHEIGHTVGWYHEHSRPDRDDHVTVLYDNILRGYAGNFKTFRVENYDLPYDIGSLMHYGPQVRSLESMDLLKPLALVLN